MRGSFAYYSELFAVNIAQRIAATKESDSHRFLEKNGKKTNKKKHNNIKQKKEKAEMFLHCSLRGMAVGCAHPTCCRPLAVWL